MSNQNVSRPAPSANKSTRVDPMSYEGLLRGFGVMGAFPRSDLTANIARTLAAELDILQFMLTDEHGDVFRVHAMAEGMMWRGSLLAKLLDPDLSDPAAPIVDDDPADGSAEEHGLLDKIGSQLSNIELATNTLADAVMSIHRDLESCVEAGTPAMTEECLNYDRGARQHFRAACEALADIRDAMRIIVVERRRAPDACPTPTPRTATCAG